MTRSAPTIPPPHPAPRIPSFRLPPGACDTHCHVFGPDRLYPYVPERPYTPPDAPLEMLRSFHDRMGVDRAVLVNATPHGRDNRVVTDAIATDPARYRGVGNVDEGFDDAELRRLADAGIVGCRFTFIPRLGKAPDLDMLDRIARRIAPLGWHVDLYLPASALADVGARLAALPVPYVLDHMGVVGAAGGTDHADFKALLAQVRRDPKAWVKVTCPERITAAGAPYADVAPFGRALVETAADRVLWGTDWPHPNVPAMPDDGDLVDLLPLMAPTPELQHRLLVENPARFFGFPP
jgi:predicted TIM-barrel fold metal-dependent hydrolase